MIEEALHIIADPGHIVAEVVMEVLSYFTIGRLAIWLHDRKHHEGRHGFLVSDEPPLGAHPVRSGIEQEILEDEALAKRGLRRIVIHSDTGPKTHVVPIYRDFL